MVRNLALLRWSAIFMCIASWVLCGSGRWFCKVIVMVALRRVDGRLQSLVQMIYTLYHFWQTIPDLRWLHKLFLLLLYWRSSKSVGRRARPQLITRVRCAHGEMHWCWEEYSNLIIFHCAEDESKLQEEGEEWEFGTIGVTQPRFASPFVVVVLQER